MKIRLAEFDDIKDMARINTIGWKNAYIGQLPQKALDDSDPTVKQKRWEASFAQDSAGNIKTYLAVRDSNTVGYITFGPARDPHFQGSAEIYAVYLLPEEWGKGLGYTLFQAATAALKQDGYKKFFILVLDTNLRAIEAYKRWGVVMRR